MFLILWAAITAILIGMTLTTALDKETGWWGWAFLVLIDITSLVSAVILVEGLLKSRTYIGPLLQPKMIAGLYAATFSSFGAMTAVLSQLSPKIAVEPHPLAIFDGIESANDGVKTANVGIKMLIDRTTPKTTPVILRNVIGTWGEYGANCEFTYQFSVDPDLKILRINGLKHPRSSKPYQSVASIRPFGDNGSVMFTDAEGRAAEFTYSIEGGIKSLRWDTFEKPPLRLVPCSEFY